MVALPLLAGTLAITAIRSVDPTPATEVDRLLGPHGQATVSSASCAPYFQDPTGTSGGCGGDSGEEDVTPLQEDSLGAVFAGNDVVQLWWSTTALTSDTAAIDAQEISEAQDADVLAELVAVREGRLPSTRGEIAINAGTAARLDVGVGDSITIERAAEVVTVQIVGLLDPRMSTGAAVTLAGTFPLDWHEADPRWFVIGDVPVTWEQVLAANQHGWEVISRQVMLDPPALADTPYGQQFPAVDDGRTIQMVGLAGAVLVMGLLEIVLLIGPAFAVGAKRSARHLALLASAGGSPADVRRVVLATGVVTGGLAAPVAIVLGLALAFAGTLIVNRVEQSGYLALVLPTWELGVLAVVGIGLGLAASWIPARSASRRDVSAALAGRRADPRPMRGIGWLGLALVVLGLLALALGAVATTPVALVAGVAVLEVGVVVLSGVLVVAVGRLAPHLGVAGRFALRDGVRHRSRTAPAVAAVIAAVAAAAAGAIYLNGESTANDASWQPLSQDPGLVLIYEGQSGDGDEVVAQALARLESEIDAVAAVPLTVAAPTRTDDGVVDPYGAWLVAETDPELSCPDAQSPDDPRCYGGPDHMATAIGFPSAFIDDGTLVSMTGLPGSEEAAHVLAAGGVVVSAASVWADGDARLRVDTSGSETDAPEVVGPAYGTTWFVMAYDVVLSPAAAGQLGLEPLTVGALVTTGSEVSSAEIDRLNAIVRGVSPNLWLRADRATQGGVPIAAVLVAIATAVALIAVGLAVGLAGADTRPDMATLAAIGAPPRTRRRIAAAQAGVIAGTGAVLGVLTGIPIGLVLSLWGRQTSGFGDLWPLAVPWQVPVMVLVIPIVTMGCAWLLTRSRLEMLRSVDA